ncbi:hypothetical protein [Streptococcus cuniculi]|uniref:hypothetical protein n=1 Tax=Streptococcus cuniculi TaxID=1432788 RepID=UPI00142FE5B8|nr:hypothetical protein [Streptococcus cuniculi]MBF0778466.1 hypothetical protein [Streptococcus cuniculi]
MSKRNELLEADIKERIEEVRYERGEKEAPKQSLFYLIIVLLVTLSILFSLLRFVG